MDTLTLNATEFATAPIIGRDAEGNPIEGADVTGVTATSLDESIVSASVTDGILRVGTEGGVLGNADVALSDGDPANDMVVHCTVVPGPQKGFGVGDFKIESNPEPSTARKRK